MGEVREFPSPCIAYTHLYPGTIARTVEAGDSIMVDVDADGRVLGVETLTGAGWEQGLVRLAMEGRLAVLRTAPGPPSSPLPDGACMAES